MNCEKYIDECIHIFRECGLIISIQNSCYKYVSPQEEQFASIIISGDRKYTITINRNFKTAKDDEELVSIFKMIICHEFCHYMQLEYGFEHWYSWNYKDLNLSCYNKYSYELASLLIYKDSGHTELWQRYANQINAHHLLAMDIIAYADKNFVNFLREKGVAMENLNVKENEDGTYTIEPVAFVERPPEGVTVEDIISKRVDLKDYLLTPVNIEEALLILKRQKDQENK